MFNRFRKLRMEHMEPRQMMAGDVTAFVENGNLFVNEAAGQAGRYNTVAISQLANGMVRVEGIDIGQGDRSLINGAAYQDFIVWGNLSVNLGGGQDYVQIRDFRNNAVKLQNIDLNLGVASAVGDADQLSITNVQTNGWLHISTGASDDWISVHNTTIGDGMGTDDFSIRTGAGADDVYIDSGTQIRGHLDIQAYDSGAEDDNDMVLLRHAFVAMDANIRMGQGDDQFWSTLNVGESPLNPLLRVDGSLTVDTSFGDDKVWIEAADIGSDYTDKLSILTSSGADSVDIHNYGHSLANLEIQTYSFWVDPAGDLQNDRDQVTIENARIMGSLQARLGRGDDVFSLLGGSVGDNLLLETGDGNDDATLSGFAVDELMARMGSGDDELTIGKVWANLLSVHGEDGVDKLVKTTVNSTSLYQSGWEWINGAVVLQYYPWWTTPRTTTV